MNIMLILSLLLVIVFYVDVAMSAPPLGSVPFQVFSIDILAIVFHIKLVFSPAQERSQLANRNVLG